MDSTNKDEVRILIVDDHNLFREGLRALLEDVQGFSVVGEAANGREAMTLVDQLHPDVLLLDLQMPRLSGMEVLRRLGSTAAYLHTILLVAEIEKEQIEEAFRLGARGVILKESAAAQLIQCISSVAAGQYWIGREPAPDLSRFWSAAEDTREAKGRSKNYGLTRRELEILAAIVAGKTNRELAAQFSISEQTVKHHVTNIFDKVGVYNRLELALFAIHHGLVGSKAYL